MTRACGLGFSAGRLGCLTWLYSSVTEGEDRSRPHLPAQWNHVGFRRGAVIGVHRGATGPSLLTLSGSLPWSESVAICFDAQVSKWTGD